MLDIGKYLCERRKLKGLTQDELAENAKVNLRTIQRIEKGETEARAKTLSLVCEALDIDKEWLLEKSIEKPTTSISSFLINAFFIVVLNILLIVVFGFLCMDSNTTINSKVGAILLSVFIPFAIVFYTQAMPSIKRLLYFGSGLIAYLLMFFFLIDFPTLFYSGLPQSTILFLAVLFYGNHFVSER